MLGTRTTLYLLLSLVVLSLAAENDATPVARLSAAGGLFRCKDDRLCGCTFGDEFAATLCDECRLGLLVALDDRSRFDGKLSTICNIYPSLEEISAFYGAQNEAYMSRSAEKWVSGLCFNELGVCG